MFINSEDLKNYLVMTAACNGNAYRDSKNTARAIKEAKASALAAFTEHLREAAAEAERELAADWYEDELNEAIQQKRAKIMQDLSQRDVVEITEVMYWEYLEAVPPLDFGHDWFYMGEPYSHTGTGTPIHLKCWIENDKFYAQYQEVK